MDAVWSAAKLMQIASPYIDNYFYTDITTIPMVLGTIGRATDRGAYGGNGIRRVLDLDLNCGGNSDIMDDIFRHFDVLFALDRVYPPGVTLIDLKPDLTPRALHYIAQEMSAQLKLGLKCQGPSQGNQSVKVVDELVLAIKKRLDLTDVYLNELS